MNDRACVCIPAHDEQDHLPAVLACLARQQDTARLRIVVALNNCTDDSVAVTRQAAHRHEAQLDIVADVIQLPPEQAHVGTARARAMDLGASWLAQAGAPARRQVLLTTDADATPPPDWLAVNLAAIDAGADLVGGRLVTTYEAAFSGDLKRRHEQLATYWEAVRALEDRLDPVAEDPAPRHGDHTGASLAVRRLVYQAVGGMPLLSHGEDTAFVRAAVSAGYSLRHPLDVWVGVSGREVGRAAGGMAASMKATREACERGEALLLPGAAAWLERLAWRAATRATGGSAAVARGEAALAPLADSTQVDLAIAELGAALALANSEGAALGRFGM